MPEVQPHSVIYGLPLMSFRGLDAPPYDLANVDFSHSHGVRPYPYIDGAAHDWTGLDPQNLQFNLYFLNTLEAGAFPDTWEEWRKELFDGSPGEMVHPLLGPLDVVVRSGSIQLTARSTAGVVVNVTFASTIRDPEDEQTFDQLAINIAELADAAVEAADNAGISLPSEETAVDLSQIGDQLSGFAFGLELAAEGIINKAQKTLSDMIDIADTLDHTTYEARDALVALWAGLEDLGKKVGVQQQRDVAEIQVKNTTTLDAFARERGNTIEEIKGLNVSAMVSPSVPANTTLRYYTS
jgi:hypothetical protein